jgi:hypothetical protein
MPLPASWIEHLFGKLSLRYGAAFLRQWPDADPELIKADWADVLHGFDGQSIGFALRYLPTERPPNALQFREICRRAPVNNVPQLTHEGAKADTQRVAEIMSEAKAALSDADTPARRVMDGLRARLLRGERLSGPQRDQLQAIESMLGVAPCL